jgi:tRNA(adenine34) deaminase
MSDFDFNSLDHETFMRAALDEAVIALNEGEMPIGAVIVHHNRIISRGRAQHRARQSEIAHAELNALLEAEHYLHQHNHSDCMLYTTVEPCVMCLGAVVMSDVDHVVYSLADHNIHPEQMLAIPYVRKHIKNYLGGILEAESQILWEKSRPRILHLIMTGMYPD